MRRETVKIVVIHGPNLNLLGLREPEVYGALNLDQINERMKTLGEQEGLELRISQSNHEGAIIDTIHAALDWADAIVINPGAYTHYAHAIADALRGVRLPAVEVHLTNVHAREEWRRRSVVSPAVAGQIAGFGTTSYLLSLEAVRDIIIQGRS